MRTPKSSFYAYRYMVTLVDNQMSIVHELNESKEKLITDIITCLSTNVKTSWVRNKKKYVFYGFQKSDNVHIIKFVKVINESIFLEGDDDVEVQGIESAKYIHLIIDTNNQIILFERNASVFQHMQTAIDLIADFLREKMKEYDYVVNVYPLVSKRKFWNYIENADEIYELTLLMNAPNFALFGHEDTRSVLKGIKDLTNNEQVEIVLKNKEGGLRIVRDAVGSYIDYIREVGGRYILKYSESGILKTKSSDSDVAKAYIEKRKSEKYSEDEMRIITEKLNAINQLNTREDEN